MNGSRNAAASTHACAGRGWYAASFDGAGTSAFDSQSAERKIAGQIPTGAKESYIFVRTSDGKRINTANLHAGSVSVLDVRARRLVKMIQVSQLVNRIALLVDDKRLFVTDGKSPNVIMLDTATDEIMGKIAVASPPFSVYPSPDGKWLLVGEDFGKGKLQVSDLGNLTVTHAYDVDRLPYGMKMIGQEAFIACYLSGNLNILNLETWKMESPIMNVAHGRWARRLEPPRLTHGRMLIRYFDLKLL